MALQQQNAFGGVYMRLCLRVCVRMTGSDRFYQDRSVDVLGVDLESDLSIIPG